MTRIQSSVGLITGIPIEETVNKLMAVAARPRELVVNRNKLIESERLAITNLTSLMLAFEFEVNKLSTANLFQAKTVTSSDSDVLSAKLATGGNPALGNYQIRPLQTATAHQLASGSLQSFDDLASGGTLTFGFGGHVDKGISLAELNGGAGVRRGQIRITDRAGNAANVDLRLARTVDDVLNAINNNGLANVSAVAVGDTFKLIDTSGGTGNLRVQELGGGQTALDLGLAGINVAVNEATGTDILTLHDGTKLASINDGNGVPLAAGADLQISLADGTGLSVDLGEATTLGEVLEALNAANPAKLSASIAADGRRIELTDLTVGAGTFVVASVGSGTAAEALGLATTVVGGTLTGGRLISGLRDTLVSSLRGGQGIGTLGNIDITNRNNVTSSVDLSAAETVADIVAAINAQAVGVTAEINSARNGIALRDTTGGTASNLIVEDADATNTATNLGIVFDEAADAINSGTLARQQISRATLLSSLNGGKGIDIADILIVDSNGVTGAVDLNTVGNEAKTIGDVIDRINAITTASVEARINDAGDGILLVDNAGGDGTLEVREVGNNTAAADLRLLGTGVVADVGGVSKQIIDGTSQFTVDLGELEGPISASLSSLNAGAGVPLGAFKITDGTGKSAGIVLDSTFETVGDVVDAINATNLDVEARLNDAGTGILLFETVNGSATLKVEELAGGTTAAALGLAREAKDKVIDGVTRQAIDGAGTISGSAAQTGLVALATKINSLEAGVTASAVFDGIGYRLILTADETGAGRELLVDGLDADLSFEELSRPRDAVIEFGGSSFGGGLLVASPDNTFDEIIPGVELTVLNPSDENVTVEVDTAQSDLVTAVQDLVDAFNSVRANLDEVTSFNEVDQTTGILFGTTAVLRVESDLNRILSGQFFGVGSFTSLGSIGLTFDDQGKLELDTAKLEEAFAEDPAALEQLFTHDTLGLSAKLKAAIEQLAGEGNSVLGTRAETLADIINNNKDRIAFMDARLTRQREALLAQFFQLESTIAAMQDNLTALSGLQVIPPLGRTS
ncbi:MAG TPA: flagellar filament capping protein FliD [Lacipirellulaceae bacterium]|nr:flagellar filament capping protein FliD [Lacipirellulaceae bacterium]